MTARSQDHSATSLSDFCSCASSPTWVPSSSGQPVIAASPGALSSARPLRVRYPVPLVQSSNGSSCRAARRNSIVASSCCRCAFGQGQREFHQVKRIDAVLAVWQLFRLELPTLEPALHGADRYLCLLRHLLCCEVFTFFFHTSITGDMTRHTLR